jgi:transposase
MLKLNDLEREFIQRARDRSADSTRAILRALLLLGEGKSRQQTAEKAGVHPVTVTRWVRRFREQGLEGLAQDGHQGRPLKLNPKQLEVLNQIARTPPRKLGKQFSRWTLKRLAPHFSQQVGLEVGSQHVGRQLRKMGLLRRALEPSAFDGDSGFHASPETALIWVTVASSSQQKENSSGQRVLFIGFDLSSGAFTTHRAHQRRPAQFIEFLKLLSTAYSHQRVLAITESGAVPISRAVWQYLHEESGRLDLVFRPPQRIKRNRSSGRLDTERRGSEICFLFNSPEWVIENLKKEIAALKRKLAKEAAFASVSRHEAKS